MAEPGPISMDFMYWGKKYNAVFRVAGITLADSWDRKKERCLAKLKEKVIEAGGNWHDEFDNPDEWPGRHYRVNKKVYNKEEFEELKAKHKGLRVSDDSQVEEPEEETLNGDNEVETTMAKSKKKKGRKPKREKLFKN